MKKLIEQVLDEDKPPGMTPLFRAVNTECALKLKNVFFKYEGAGPTGTQKDRISRLHINLAKSLGYDTVSVATCGNYGASVSYFAYLNRMKSVVAIPSFYAGSRNSEIYENGSDIIVKNMKYEDLVEYIKAFFSTRREYCDSISGRCHCPVIMPDCGMNLCDASIQGNKTLLWHI